MSLLEVREIEISLLRSVGLDSVDAEGEGSTLLALPLDWMDRAVCKGRTHLFFPPKAERPQARVRRETQARKLCASCPVQIECQSFARENREYGYWGGESEEDRHLAGFTVAAPIGVRSRRMREAG